MPSTGVVFDRIDALLERIRKFANEPEFLDAFEERRLAPDYEKADSAVLRIMIALIAYSQGARADRIGAMRERGVFEDVFGSFEPANVARMDPEEIRKNHWAGKLSPMRFPDKINKMIDCAQSLHQIANRHGSFMRFLRKFQLPDEIRSDADIDLFWDAFEQTRSQAPPFFQNFISLCHLLQIFHFPCAKPDKVVMKVAAELGIINDRKQYPEAELRNVVRCMQSYAVQRGFSVPQVDLILLIHGNQTWARTLVRSSYYR
jgi:hypothetical protein